jgi:predicted O-linked N-acetylglucosamine transferase (SPINDLY family)
MMILARMYLQQLAEEALRLHQQGREREAERLYLQILAASPQDLTAGCMLGAIRFNQQRPEEAMALFDAALRAHPPAIGPLLFYGQLLQTAGRFDRALECFNWVLALDPNHLDALISRGSMLRDLGQLEAAVQSFDRAIAIAPRSAAALNNRGNALRGLGRFGEALASFDRALALEPGQKLLRFNRALTFADMKRFGEALADFDRLLQELPDDARILYNRGLALEGLRRPGEALESYERAIAVNPSLADAHLARGQLLTKAGRYDEALESHDQALSIMPDFSDALYNRGNLLWLKFHRLAAARQDLEKACRLNPDRAYLKGDLVHLKIEMCDWRGLEEETTDLIMGVRQGQRIVRPATFQALSSSPEDLQRAAVIYGQDRFPRETPLVAPLAVASERRPPGGKIRIGYVGGEFREHAMAFLMAGLYEQHDKTKFEIIAFDVGWDDGSPLRRRLQAAFDKWVDVSELNDLERAERIRDEKVDILVNIIGYFQSEPMGIFARRPAPVQVSYLGYPATLGAPYIDYLVADRIVIPEEEQSFYTENIVYLPDTYWANDSKRAIADTEYTRSACGLPEEGFVFCNFNQIYKLTPHIFAIWMDILKEAENSVFWLLGSNEESVSRLKEEAERLGVAGERLVFAPPLPSADHLARIKLADLCLDSLPYNAHTTACDCLWAGVPILTCQGSTFPGRVAASVLHAVGLPELITENLKDYRGLALRLAKDAAYLAELRRRLRENRLIKPLFDTARFCRHIEAAYTRMWEMSQRGESPQGFTVTPIA